MDSLPYEIISLIAGYLNGSDVINLARSTCPPLLEDNHLWWRLLVDQGLDYSLHEIVTLSNENGLTLPDLYFELDQYRIVEIIHIDNHLILLKRGESVISLIDRIINMLPQADEYLISFGNYYRLIYPSFVTPGKVDTTPSRLRSIYDTRKIIVSTDPRYILREKLKHCRYCRSINLIVSAYEDGYYIGCGRCKRQYLV